MTLQWTPKVLKQLRKLPHVIADRITQKMEWYVRQDDPLSFAEHLTNPRYGKYRFRIGDYRVICDVKRDTVEILIVLTIGKRDSIYDDL